MGEWAMAGCGGLWGRDSPACHLWTLASLQPGCAHSATLPCPPALLCCCRKQEWDLQQPPDDSWSWEFGVGLLETRPAWWFLAWLWLVQRLCWASAANCGSMQCNWAPGPGRLLALGDPTRLCSSLWLLTASTAFQFLGHWLPQCLSCFSSLGFMIAVLHCSDATFQWRFWVLVRAVPHWHF